MRGIRVIIVVVLVALAGCSGLTGSPADSSSDNRESNTANTVSETPGNGGSNPASSSSGDCQGQLTSLIPSNPDGFSQQEDTSSTMLVVSESGVSTYSSEEISAGLVGADDAKSNQGEYYTGPDNEQYYLSVSRWQSHEAAAEGAENISIFAGVAVDGRTLVSATGPNQTYSEQLVTSVGCIEQSEIIEQDFTINSSDLNITGSGGTPSISNVEATTVSTESGEAIQVTVEGESNGSPLTVGINGPDASSPIPEYIPSENMTDGQETVEVELLTIGSISGGQYTVNVSQGYDTEPIYQENITISGAEISIESVDIETQEEEFGDGYTISSSEITLVNNGNLPASLFSIDVSTNGESSQLSIFESIEPGDEYTKSTDEFSVLSSLTLEEGTNRVTVEVVIDEQVVDEKTVTVTT